MAQLAKEVFAIKELHIYMDTVPDHLSGCCCTYKETEKAVVRHDAIIHTTQLPFFSMSVHLAEGYDIYVHNNRETIAIRDSAISGYGKVRPSQHIYSMLLAGCFGLI